MPDFPSSVPNRAALEMLQGSHYNDPPFATRKLASPSSYKKGGKVKKSGLALVHKGERVLSRAGQVLSSKKIQRRKKPRKRKRVRRTASPLG